ncbi:MAG: GNAT family N-acetyltransferase [Bryobacteraceae bacterium]|nr:GNAT family N-acetyltransferase [Bryobacteraceae bacterium]
MGNSLFPRLFRRAIVILKEDGLLALGFRVLGETVYRRVLLASCNPAHAGAPPDARCRWLDPAESAAYARFHPEVAESEIRHRFAEGHRCWVLTSGGQFAHGLWIAPRAWIGYLELDLPLAPNEIYLYQTFTPPSLRGHGFASAALLAVLSEMRREGWQRVILCIQPDRSIAYSPLYRAGFKPYGYVGWYRVGRTRWTFRRAANRFPFYAPPAASAEGTEE